jgi:hypothetical protein
VAVVQQVAATEIERRTSARSLAVKDLCLILMKSGHDRGWIPTAPSS